MRREHGYTENWNIRDFDDDTENCCSISIDMRLSMRATCVHVDVVMCIPWAQLYAVLPSSPVLDDAKIAAARADEEEKTVNAAEAEESQSSRRPFRRKPKQPDATIVSDRD